MIRAAAVLALAWTAAAPVRASDLILYNGNIFVSPGRHARALAVAGNRISAVGEDAEVLRKARPETRLVDLAGRAVTPGFHDAHVHFSEGARSSRPEVGGMEGAVREARRLGVTSISGLLEGDGVSELEFWAEQQRLGQATLRYWMWGDLGAPEGFLAAKQRFSPRLPADRFHWSGLKGYVDGDFADRSAALIDAYSDMPDSRGVLRLSPRELRRAVVRGREAGLSVHLHAIGDRAVRVALDACSAVLEEGSRKRGAGVPAPCVIEHADLFAPEDLRRFAASGAVASMQPGRMTADDEDRRYPERLGPRARRTFALKSLQASGAELAFGSDWPDKPLDPLLGLFAATTQPGPGGSSGERISLEEAIAHYTRGSARAVGAERELGVIRPGFLADLVVFDRDLFALPGAELLKARVDATIFDGKVVHVRVDARGF